LQWLKGGGVKGIEVVDDKRYAKRLEKFAAAQSTQVNQRVLTE